MLFFKRAACVLFLAVGLCVASQVAEAQTSQPPYLYRETWYEFVLKQFNPAGVDYGSRIEQRRTALLEATVHEPSFWYSLFMTVLALLLMGLSIKLYLDNRRRMRVTADMMADVYSHDLVSRQIAREAIQKHNEHIEICNRAIEGSENGDGRPGWGETHTDALKAELQRAASQLEATTQERNKLQEELRQKSLVVSDLSIRLDALSKRVSGNGKSNAPSEMAAAAGKENGTVVVDHINRLQEELYAERQKNRRVKGS